MGTSGTLNLAHNVVLLTLDPDSGARRRRGLAAFAAAGALLVDLETAGRIALRDRRVYVVDATPTGDASLDITLALMAASEPRTPARWITRLRERGRLATRLLDELVAAGTIARSPRRMLRASRYPVRDRLLLSRIRDSARKGLTTPATAPVESAALGGFMYSMQLGAAVAPHTRLGERMAAQRTLRRRIWQVDAVARVIAAAQASSA
ncbi:hypothetical protein GCM10009785_04580 [Brooklawnia cerclae]|uniref:GPP34 family phosphoprotein n=1 Tax=Brooklawnia cerclae TaxID=349934 RepID=A0ABX0SFI8_9ACTN|nr:GPP34 family phosphoprotein [Brooklawnia cerclae]NIH55950.1 hypothetical protein [Brooklawnia cerclae]